VASVTRPSLITALKALVVLGALAFATSRVGLWSIGSWTRPESERLPARAPIALADLKQALDAEFAPIVRDGLLKDSTGCGVAIGIIDHGHRRIFTYGAARADSIFQIGSVTKTFTGLALAQLASQGKVKLDEPIRPILFPEDAALSENSQITLLDLVTHRSGLPSVPENLTPTNSSNPFANYDRVAIHQFLASHGTTKPADAKYLYSSFGIAVLGYALAQRAGVPYAQLVRTEITAPLRMYDTAFNISSEQSQRMLQGHDSNLDPVDSGLGDDGIFAGAIGAKSTAEDLLTYLDANLNPGHYAVGAVRRSPAATLPNAIALDHHLRGAVDQNTQIAFSWLYNVKAERFEHGGTTPGFTAHVEFAPKRDRAIVVLYNRMDEMTGQTRFVDRIAENINDLMSGAPAVRIDIISESDPALAALDSTDSDL
jgi:D-alanyl-D-alanine-carboxypeptidase/D-alanyl-D-alanine-endopeptidase